MQGRNPTPLYYLSSSLITIWGSGVVGERVVEISYSLNFSDKVFSRAVFIVNQTAGIR